MNRPTSASIRTARSDRSGEAACRLAPCLPDECWKNVHQRPANGQTAEVQVMDVRSCCASRWRAPASPEANA